MYPRPLPPAAGETGYGAGFGGLDERSCARRLMREKPPCLRANTFGRGRDDDGLSVRIAQAELTEPYALLLADNFADGVLAEAEAIKRSAKAEGGPAGKPPSDLAAVSYFDEMVGQFSITCWCGLPAVSRRVCTRAPPPSVRVAHATGRRVRPSMALGRAWRSARMRSRQELDAGACYRARWRWDAMLARAQSR